MRGWFGALLPRLRNASRLQVALGAAVVVIVVTGAVAGVLAATGSSKRAATKSHPAPSTTKGRALPKKAAPVRVTRCPLTNVRPPGPVPRRPALMVKIGNEPAARPQSGLNEADVVFDTPAEGFIMRYVAVYQCQGATAIGPLRSVRWVDYHIAPQLGRPILAFAGGIDPNVQAVGSLPWLTGANLLMAQANAGYRTSDRQPPDNLYTSTDSLYGLFPRLSQRPKPIFEYTTALPPGATPAASAELDFSGDTHAIWQWQPSTHSWLHTYSGSPDIDRLTNQPVTATNVVVQVVPYSIGPYIESTGGSGDIQSETTGSGTGYVLRDGHSIPIFWHRASPTSPLTFSGATGRPVGLASGRTWVEIMTDSQAANGIHLTP